MTIINPNSIAGITSVTAEAGVMNFYKSDGTLAGLQLNGVNFNTTSGISTFNNVYVGGTITYEDVKNVDSVGIITARTGVRITGGGLNVVGVTTIAHAEVSTAQFTGSYVNVDGNLDIADSIRHLGDSNTKIRFPANDTITAETAGSERLRIDSSGRVLIGTTDPGSGNADELTLAGSGSSGLTIRSGTSNTGSIFFSDATSGAAQYAGAVEFNHGDNEMKFMIGNSPRLRIQSTGIVKVETSDSSSFNAHFLVNNSESNSGVSLIGSGSSFSAGGWAAVTDAGIIRSSANSSNGLVLQAASGDMRFYVGGNPPAERVRITSAGRVLIGDSAATSLLSVGGTNYNWDQGDIPMVLIKGHNNESPTSGTNNIAFQIEDENNNLIHRVWNTGGGNSDVGKVYYAGKVGIGTVNPSNQLHIADYSADADVTIQATASGKDARLNLYGNSTGVCQIRLGDDTDANIGRITYYHAASGTAEANSLEFITGDYARVRVASTGLVLPQTTNIIRTDTSDGSDNKRIILAAGGQNSQVRGSQIAMYGNEYSSHEGRLQLLAGNSGNTNGVIQMYSGGSERLRITSGGFTHIGIPATTNAWDTHSIAMSGANSATFACPGTLTLFGGTGFGTANMAGAGLRFVGYYDSSNFTTFAHVAGVKENTTSGNYAGALTFHTRANGGLGAERLRITSGGELVFAGDTDTFIDHPNANQIEITAGNIEVATFIDGQSNKPAMLIDKGGVNNTTAGANYNSNANANDLVVGNVSSGNHGITVCSVSSGTGYINFSDGSGGGADAYRGSISYEHANALTVVRAKTGNVVLRNDGTDTLVATSGGDVGINDDTSGWAEKLQVTGDYGNQYAIAAKIGQSSGSIMRFGTTSGVCGSITGNGTNSAFNSSSDYRLKENDVRISDGISRVKQLRPIRFNWKSDSSTTQDGFFAHEVSPVVPESVTGEKDAPIDEIGAGYQMIDHSKLVPLLTAALQEAIAEIETLKTKVTALEGS